MIYKLELSKGLAPEEEGDSIKFTTFTFPGGEPHIKIKREKVHEHDTIEVYIRILSWDSFGLLALAKDVLSRQYPYNEIHLNLMYYPGARQDRITSPEEPFTVNVVANMLTTMRFNSIKILDPHSFVCLKASGAKDLHFLKVEFWRRCLDDLESKSKTIVCAPDNGAIEDATDFDALANLLRMPIHCTKIRDEQTGILTGFKVETNQSIEGYRVIIVDDICDGGGTFIGVAKELLRLGAKELVLIVTHGIFSKGFKELRKYYSNIYTTNSIRESIPVEIEKGSDIVTIVPISELW